MPRHVLALVLLTVVSGSATDALAGQRCIKRPDVVLWSPMLDVHDNGTWHRATNVDRGREERGTISRKAVTRLQAMTRATLDQQVACANALIANEKSKAATKACTPPKK